MSQESSRPEADATPNDVERMVAKRREADRRFGLLALQLELAGAFDEPSVYTTNAGSDRLVVATTPLMLGINALTGDTVEEPGVERAALFVNRFSRPDAAQLNLENVQMAAYIVELGGTNLFARRDLKSAVRTDSQDSFGASVPGFVSVNDAKQLARVSEGWNIIDEMTVSELATTVSSLPRHTLPSLLAYQQDVAGLSMQLDRREGFAVQLG